MARTGETYQQALRHVLSRVPAPPAAFDCVEFESFGERHALVISERFGMYFCVMLAPLQAAASTRGRPRLVLLGPRGTN